MPFRSALMIAAFTGLLTLGAFASTLAQTTPVKEPAKPAASLVPRPNQYVALAFDGSQTLGVWDATRQFSKDLKAKNIEVHFTYFISGVYFLDQKNKSLYQGPHHLAGRSDIGFGDDEKDISLRIDQVNLAHREGHEIGSHANGHFSGAAWSAGDWTSEFTQFNKLIFGAFENNKIPFTTLFPTGWTLDLKEIVGFRAPLLDYDKGLYAAEKAFNYRYDTSQTAETNYWPEKNGTGQWNFPLGEVVIAGTAKHTLSMDYNFYYAQSGAKDGAAHSELYEKQMYETYMHYFSSNYNGNRAPVNIGHHFSQWNGGAYWRAMKHFAESVCGLPEVKCTTYKELADFMDATPAATRLAYVHGNFQKGATLQTAGLTQPINLKASVTHSSNGFAVSLGGSAAASISPSQVRWVIDNQDRGSGPEIPASFDQLREGSTVGIKVLGTQGDEILARTHRVIRNSQTHELQLSEHVAEDRALQGDLPEAHRETEQSMTGNEPGNTPKL